MTVCFTPYVHDAGSDSFALPHSGREDQEDFELDVSNANAVDILLALGLNPSPNGDAMPIDAFANLVTAALRHHLGARSQEMPTVEDAQPGRMTMIYLGRDEGYVERKLGAAHGAVGSDQDQQARRPRRGPNRPARSAAAARRRWTR